MSQLQRGPQAKYHGLVNQGATCYLNSVLQVLFMTKTFRESVTSHSHIKNEEKKGNVETELSDLFSTLEKHQADTHSLTRKLKITNVFEQRDAADHYEKILRNISPRLSKIFHGEIINRNICQECNAKTETAAGFWSLPLPLLNDNNEYSVEKGIKDFFRPSKISGDDQMYCEKCEKKCDAVLDCEVTHYPKVLVLLLKRFELTCVGNVWENVKINCPVKMPDTLQMEQDKIYTQYKLYAYVEHCGSLQHGHYTATIKSQDDGQWYIFNDLNVEVSSYDHFQLDPTETSKSVYLLFYQKEKDTSVDRHNTPVTLPTTTLLNGIEDHRSSSKEEAVNSKYETNDQPVTPVSKRNMKEDRPRNDEQNDRKRRKTNKKHELGPEECSERSQVLEDRHKETGQNFDLGKLSKHREPNVKGSYRNSRDVKIHNKYNEGEDQVIAKMKLQEHFSDDHSLQKARWDTQHVCHQDVGQSKHAEPNVKGSYRASRDVNEKPKMHNKHKEGEDQAMTKIQQPEYLLDECSPQKAGWDTQHASQQDSRHQNFDSVRQSKHKEPNVESSYRDSSDVHEKGKMHNKRNEEEDQAMAEMQHFRKPDEYSTQKPRCDKHVKGLAEYSHDGMRNKDRERQSRQVNCSNSYAPSQNQKIDCNQSNDTRDKQNVSQQFFGTALNGQNIQRFENKHGPYIQVRRTKSSAPSQNRTVMDINWQLHVANPGNSIGRRGESLVSSFHEPHRQYYSQDNQLENFRKEIQNTKMRNNGLKKNSRDGQNDNFQKHLETMSEVSHCKEQKPRQTNPQQCLARWESHQSNYRQNLQTSHSQKTKGSCDDDMGKMKDRNKLCNNIAKPEAELTRDNLAEEMKCLSLSSRPKNSEEELETNCHQSRKRNKCLPRCLHGLRHCLGFLSCKKKTHKVTRHARYQV